MKVAIFDTHQYDRKALEDANCGRHELLFLETRLSEQTVALARGAQAVCCFVNDLVNETVISALKNEGVKLITLRSAGYNHVDLDAAKRNGITVTRVPEYSPYAVAEHAVALLLDFNRKIYKAHNRVRDFNFSLDGLVGFDLHGKRVGVIGTGKIGRVFAKIMTGFGCKVMAFDTDPDHAWATSLNVEYAGFDDVLMKCDIISLHLPLFPETRYLINQKAFSLMKPEVILINTGRGALIETSALIQALKNRTISGACLDVYEEEEGVFFSDLSEAGLSDDVLARLLTFPNVLITSHQGFLTREALSKIAETTLQSLTRFESGIELGAVELR